MFDLKFSFFLLMLFHIAIRSFINYYALCLLFLFNFYYKVLDFDSTIACIYIFVFYC